MFILQQTINSKNKTRREGKGGGVGWASIRGWALINFFCLKDGRLFEMGANLRLRDYSNKYGMK